MPKLKTQTIAFSSLSLVMTLCMNIACANDDAIQTDRPGLAESSNVVGKGVFQLETSYSVELDRHDGQKYRTSTTPTLIRIGIGENWEFRIETDGRIGERTTSESTGQATTLHGYGDLSLGTKWHLQDNEGAIPALAWLIHADFDTGSTGFHGKGMRPSLRASAEWELKNGYSLGVMPGIIYDKSEEGTRYFAGIVGIVLNKSLTERFRTFVEVSAPQIARAKYGGSFVTYDTGLIYLLNKDCQLDFIVQKGANHNTPDLTWAIGFSTRFK